MTNTVRARSNAGMSCSKQLKILASAIAFAVCADAYAYNLAWLDEKAADGVLFVTNTIADAGKCMRTTDAYYAFTNSACWTDKKEPHENAVYFNGGLQMRLDTANYSFPGEGFILTGGIFYMHQQASFNYVGVEEDATIQAYQYLSAGLKNGVIDIASGKTLKLITSYNGGEMWVDSEVRGAGDITLTIYTGTDSPGVSTHVFAGVNTGWTGSLLLKTGYLTSRSYPNHDKGYLVFNFSDGRALGGRKEAFEPDALTLASFVRFTPTASTQLAEGLNRGLYVGDPTDTRINAGVFSIGEGITLTNHWPMTVHGTVYKEGSGTLELASDCRFPNDAVPTSAARHTLMLSAGTVRVSHVDALNGLIVDVSSAQDKALALDLSKTEGELFAFGIRNTKTVTPFAGDKLPIVFENATLENLSAIYAAGGKFGVVTVADSAADATEAKLGGQVLPDVAGCECSLVRTSNGDDTTTFALKVRAPLIVPIDVSGPAPVSTPLELPTDYDFPLGETVGLRLSQKIPLPLNDGATLPLVTYSGTVVLTPEMFADESEKTYDLPRTTIVVSSADGVQTVSAVVRPVICDVDACDNLDTTFDGTAATWSDGQPVHRGADYVRTHKLKKAGGSGINYGTFSGDSLTLADREVTSTYGTVTIPKTVGGEVVRAYGWRTGSGQSESSYAVAGYLFLGGAYDDDPVNAFAFYPYLPYYDSVRGADDRYTGSAKKGQVYLSADLSGEGPLYFCPTPNISIAGILGDNTNYFGRIFLDGKEMSKTGYYYGMHVRVNSANNFGGRLAAFRPDSITMQKMAYFRAEADIALTNDMNRGITFQTKGGGFVVEEGCTFTLGWPLRLDAGIQKHGAGTLRLAGSITRGANYERGLTVTEGTLAVANDTAVSGLDVVFSNGVTLALSPSVATGFKNGFKVLPADGSGTPGKISVTVDLPADERPNELQFAICETKDENLVEKLRPLKARGYTVPKIVRTQVGEKYRYEYVATRSGMVLIFR